MGMTLKGFDELDKKLESLGNVGKKVGAKAVREGMKPIVEQMKKDAPKDTGKGAKALKTTTVKTYRTGTAVARAGINKTNWEKAKHLVFQHYGYENKGLNMNGKKVTVHVGWMSKSFEKSKSKGEKVMREIASQEINNILKS